MKKISRADWGNLTDAAWEWDPIGVPRNEFTTGEYDCLVEQVVPLLQRGATASEIVAHFDRFFPEHFGIPLRQSGCERFAQYAIKWWHRVHG
jgi:hypothetical protein